jgi:hypothetical protein
MSKNLCYLGHLLGTWRIISVLFSVLVSPNNKIITTNKIENCLAMGLLSYNYKRFRVYTLNLEYTNMLQNLICKISTLDVKCKKLMIVLHENFIIFFTLHSCQKYLCQTTNQTTMHSNFSNIFTSFQECHHCQRYIARTPKCSIVSLS